MSQLKARGRQSSRGQRRLRTERGSTLRKQSRSRTLNRSVQFSWQRLVKRANLFRKSKKTDESIYAQKGQLSRSSLLVYLGILTFAIVVFSGSGSRVGTMLFGSFMSRDDGEPAIPTIASNVSVNDKQLGDEDVYVQPFTPILSPEDLIRYRYLFQAAEQGNVAHISRLIDHVDDDVLVGLVKYRVLTRKREVSDAMVNEWLSNYKTFPEVYAVRKIALENKISIRSEQSIPAGKNASRDEGARLNRIEFIPERAGRHMFDASATSQAVPTEPNDGYRSRVINSHNSQARAGDQSLDIIQPTKLLTEGNQTAHLDDGNTFITREVTLPEQQLEQLQIYAWHPKEFASPISNFDLNLTPSVKIRNSLHRSLVIALSHGQVKHALALYKSAHVSELRISLKAAINASMIEGLTLRRKYAEARDILFQMSERERLVQPQAMWWAGLSAYALGDYRLAENLWHRHARLPLVSEAQRARSWYWAASAAIKDNKTDLADQYMENAKVSSPFTLYSYLANASGRDREMEMIWRPLWPNVDLISDQEGVRRALALVEVEQYQLADEHLANRVSPRASSEELAAYATVADILKLPMTAFRASWYMFSSHGVLYPRALYPLPYWQDDLPSTISVDPLLSLAVVRQESAFRYGAISGSGARGLMQLMPYTASDVSGRRNTSNFRQDLFKVSENIRWGSNYLDYLLGERRFSGSIIHSIAAYNGGPGRIKGHYDHSDPLFYIETISPSETRNYVNFVLMNYLVYRERMNKSTEGIVFDLTNSQYPKHKQ